MALHQTFLPLHVWGGTRQGLGVLRPTFLPQTIRKPDKREPLAWASGFGQVSKAWSRWPLWRTAVRLSTSCTRRAPAGASAPPAPTPAGCYPAEPPHLPAPGSVSPPPGEATSYLRASAPHFAKPKSVLSPRAVPVRCGDQSCPQRGIRCRRGSTKQLLCPKQGSCAWHGAEPSTWAPLGECPHGLPHSPGR